MRESIEVGGFPIDAPHQPIDLIFHECDERRDNERCARQQQRDELIDQRLARSRRHHDERITTCEDMVHCSFLAGAEIGGCVSFALLAIRNAGKRVVVAIPYSFWVSIETSVQRAFTQFHSSCVQ
jgi:hypothetical protein